MNLISFGICHKALQQMPSQTDPSVEHSLSQRWDTDSAQHQEDNCSCFSTNPQNYNNSFHAIKQDKGEAWSEHFSAAHG